MAIHKIKRYTLANNIRADETFASRLARLRRARGLSQGELASLCGVSRSLIVRLETECADPLRGRLDSALRLAFVLGVTLDQLVRGLKPRAVKRGSAN